MHEVQHVQADPLQQDLHGQVQQQEAAAVEVAAVAALQEEKIANPSFVWPWLVTQT